MEKDRRGIQSIEVGGSLLQALVQHGGPMMLKDLAALAGMPAAKAHPYLVSFGKLGLIEQDAATGYYKLGSFALQVGLTALHELDAVKLATEAAAALSLEIQQNVALAVWGNHGPTVVRVQECNRVVHVNMRAGTVMSLLDSATGKVFAAFLPPRLSEDLLQAELGERQQNGEFMAHWQETLAEVRRRKMARAVGYPIPGIHALSAPVLDHSGQLAVVMTTLGPAATFDTGWDGALAARLRETAARVSAQIGYRG